jgi:hypothetical protein
MYDAALADIHQGGGVGLRDFKTQICGLIRFTVAAVLERRQRGGGHRSLAYVQVTTNKVQVTLPMTFCCYAELIWRMLATGAGEGKTQQAVADELGWSREKVRNYAALQSIDAKAWEIVGTTVRDFGSAQSASDEPSPGTTVPTFTEGLLRVLPPLLPDQQFELCRLLARGKDEKGHKFERADFTLRAQQYRALNALYAEGCAVICAAVPEGEQRVVPRQSVSPRAGAASRVDVPRVGSNSPRKWRYSLRCFCAIEDAPSDWGLWPPLPIPPLSAS